MEGGWGECFRGGKVPVGLFSGSSVLLRTVLRRDWVKNRDVPLECVQHGFGLGYPRNFSFFGRGIPQGAGWRGEEDGLFVAGFPEKWGSGVGLFQAFPSGRIRATEG